MKEFETIRFDVDRCRIETQELRDWLAGKTDLTERKDVLPFFKARKQVFETPSTIARAVTHLERSGANEI